MAVDAWSMRELYQAADFKRRQLWDDWSFALHWILNAIPNFSKTPRPPIHPDSINPYYRQPTGGRVALKRGDPAAEAALDAWTERENARLGLR